VTILPFVAASCRVLSMRAGTPPYRHIVRRHAFHSSRNLRNCRCRPRPRPRGSGLAQRLIPFWAAYALPAVCTAAQKNKTPLEGAGLSLPCLPVVTRGHATHLTRGLDGGSDAVRAARWRARAAVTAKEKGHRRRVAQGHNRDCRTPWAVKERARPGAFTSQQARY
jgi:hypothetical protein